MLVTGAAGFVGRELVPRLRRAGHAVLALDERPLEPGEPAWRVDLTHPMAAGEEAVLGPLDACVHLASTVGGFLFNVENHDLVARDRAINERVIQLCRAAGCRRMIFVSSINVFETTPCFVHGPLATLDQQSPYAVAKARAERRFAEAFDHLVVLRPTNLFGRGQARGRLRIGESHVIPDLLHKLETSPVLEVLGDGTQRRNFLHVADLCDFAQVALGLDGHHHLNLRSEIEMSIAELAHALMALRGIERPIRFRPEYQQLERLRIERFDLAPATAAGFAARVTSLADGLTR